MDNTILAQKVSDFTSDVDVFSKRVDFVTKQVADCKKRVDRLVDSLGVKRLDGAYEVRFFSKKLQLQDDYAVPLISGVKRIYCNSETELLAKWKIVELLPIESSPDEFNWYFEKL